MGSSCLVCLAPFECGGVFPCELVCGNPVRTECGNVCGNRAAATWLPSLAGGWRFSLQYGINLVTHARCSDWDCASALLRFDKGNMICDVNHPGVCA